jgi:hypothetical protein
MALTRAPETCSDATSNMGYARACVTALAKNITCKYVHRGQSPALPFHGPCEAPPRPFRLSPCARMCAQEPLASPSPSDCRHASPSLRPAAGAQRPHLSTTSSCYVSAHGQQWRARPAWAKRTGRGQHGQQGGQQGPAPLTRKEEVAKLPAAPLPCRAPVSASRDALRRRQQEEKRDWDYEISIRETKPSVASMDVFTDGHRLSIQKQPPGGKCRASESHRLAPHRREGVGRAEGRARPSAARHRRAPRAGARACR